MKINYITMEKLQEYIETIIPAESDYYGPNIGMLERMILDKKTEWIKDFCAFANKKQEQLDTDAIITNAFGAAMSSAPTLNIPNDDSALEVTNDTEE